MDNPDLTFPEVAWSLNSLYLADTHYPIPICVDLEVVCVDICSDDVDNIVHAQNKVKSLSTQCCVASYNLLLQCNTLW